MYMLFYNLLNILCKEIKPVNPKENQPWIFIGRTDTEAETRTLWPPDVKNWLIGKDPDAGKDWRQAEKGTTEDEIVGWYHQLDGYEFEQSLGVGDGQGGQECCSPWGCKELDTTELLNWTDAVGKPPWAKGSWKLNKLSWRDPLFFFYQGIKYSFLSVYLYERYGPIFLF